MGTEFWGIICPWGQKVGDQKSGDQMGSGPNELQPTYQAMQPVFMASMWARVTTDLLPEAVITMSTFLITASNLTTWK